MNSDRLLEKSTQLGVHCLEHYTHKHYMSQCTSPLRVVKSGRQSECCQQVAELLLVRGLAAVVRHRSDDERSAFYEPLMNAEAVGKNSKKGIHNKNKDPPPHHYNDVSLPGNATKAKQYLPFFQRGKHTGIVEYVLSGARLKVSSSCYPNFGTRVTFASTACMHCKLG